MQKPQWFSALLHEGATRAGTGSRFWESRLERRKADSSGQVEKNESSADSQKRPELSSWTSLQTEWSHSVISRVEYMCFSLNSISEKPLIKSQMLVMEGNKIIKHCLSPLFFWLSMASEAEWPDFPSSASPTGDRSQRMTSNLWELEAWARVLFSSLSNSSTEVCAIWYLPLLIALPLYSLFLSNLLSHLSIHKISPLI